MKTQFCSECGSTLEPKDLFCSVCGIRARPVRRLKKSGGRRTHRRTFPLPLLVFSLGSILLAAAALFYLADRPAPAAVADLPDDHDENGLPYPEVARISLLQAQVNHDNGTAVIVDVRSREEYEKSHITNAISMPLTELETRYQELPKEVEIITHCS